MDVLSATTASGRIGHCRPRNAGTLLDCLSTFGLSSDEGSHLISLGAVYHERERVSSDRLLAPGEYVRVHLHPRRFPVETIDWPAAVLYQNGQFVVVNKPAGIPVHATVDNKLENVAHQLSLALGGPIHVTQRLDIEVRGLLVLARTKEFQRQFNQLLVERKVKKRYRALVDRPPELGKHIHYMKPAKRSPRTVRIEAQPGWLECVLRIDSVQRIDSETSEFAVYEIEMDLETGRTHQIRAQLSALGSPVVGDILYGSATPHALQGTTCRGIALSSTSISWNDDDGREWSFPLDRSRH